MNMLANDDHSKYHIFLYFNKELKEFYSSLAIRSFATYLVGIFVPIYVFQFFSNSISKTFLFFGAGYFLFGLLVPLGGKIISKIGVKHSMLLAMPFLFLHYLSLWYIESLGSFVFLIIVFHLFYQILFWPAYHMDFAHFSDSKHRSSEIGYSTIIISAISAVAPFVGGLIIFNFGFGFLFGIVLILLLVSTIPLFLTEDIFEKYTLSYQEVFKKALQKKNIKKSISFFFSGIENMIPMFVWPILLFILSINFSTLGLITSGVAIFGILFIYFMGKFLDKIGSNQVITPGSIIFSIATASQIFIFGPISAFFIGTVRGFSSHISWTPYSTLFYEWATGDKNKRARSVIMRETVFNLGKGISMLIIAYLFINMNPINIKYVFLVGAVSAMSFILMKYPNKAYEKSSE